MEKFQKIRNLLGIREIRIDFTDDNVTQLNEDLQEIGRYYPEILSSVTLSNATSNHIDMQSTIDTIYSAQQDTRKSTGYLDSSEIRIESDFTEDFDLDFSNAPEVKQNPDTPTDSEEKKSTTISFASKNGTVKLPNLNGKLSDNIRSIKFENCDVEGFSVATSNPRGNSNVRYINLTGGGTKGINNLGGLGDIVKLTVNGISYSEFQDVLNLSIYQNTQMNKLFDLNIYNQRLHGTQLLSQITNQNIVYLSIFNSGLDSIAGIDNLKDQLLKLDLDRNDLNVSDLKKIFQIAKEKPILNLNLINNQLVTDRINSSNVISDNSYNYIDELFRKTGWYTLRNYKYNDNTNIEDKKKSLVNYLLSWDTKDVPYFIEDAKFFRENIGMVYNPIMINNTVDFQNLLNAPGNYFEQDYLKDATLLLTKEQLEFLINSGKTIPQEVSLKINVASELTQNEISNYETQCSQKGINFKKVQVIDDRIMTNSTGDYRNIDCGINTMMPYTVGEFKNIRSKLEEVVQGIDLNLPEVEKFAIVYQKLSQMISEYDLPAQTDTKSKEHAIYQTEVGALSRNMGEGLTKRQGFDEIANTLNGEYKYRAVCAGYADILKNALSLVGIESVLEGGYTTLELKIENGKIVEKKKNAHRWNKVKIDGKWYYADLCWDRGDVIKHGIDFQHALRGEREFCEKTTRKSSHYTYCDSSLIAETMEQDDYDQQKLRDIFARVKNRNSAPIVIPDDPDITTPVIDINRIKADYIAKKNDMYAKFYGDRDYQERYRVAASRFRQNEVEVTQNGVTYRTVQDYPERAQDEEFLILDDYKNALERTTKFEAGAAGVYTGTDAEIQAKYQRDKEYVETRNYTFDQNKNTQRDLATLGKYGERMNYIQRQQGVLKNALRVVGNVGILAKNIVAPVYRFIGRTVAQPLHRLRTRGRDASPYKNNPYHRFVARRDYFNDVANQNNTRSSVVRSLGTMLMSNVRAIFRYQEGNEAVLKAGSFDIQENLKEQEMQNTMSSFLYTRKAELETQIRNLENAIQSSPYAPNIVEARNRLTEKRNKLADINNRISNLGNEEKITDIQTDAVSQTQHDIASKEFNTYKVTVIKGVAKLGAKKFVGPPLKKWLMEHTKRLVSHNVPYQEKVITRKFIEGGKETVPITEMQPDYDIGISGLMQKAKGRTVKLFRSVSGGDKGMVTYKMSGDEICSGLHFQNGTKWGTGFSNNVPLMTDKVWPSRFLDGSGKLMQNIKFSDIAEAISNGEISKEALKKLSIQISGKGWVHADELFQGVTKSVKVGEKVIEKAGHWEDVTEMIDKVRKVTEYVDNPRVINALKTLGVTGKIASKADDTHSAFETLRTTHSNTKSNKKPQRHYDYDDSEYYR